MEEKTNMTREESEPRTESSNGEQEFKAPFLSEEATVSDTGKSEPSLNADKPAEQQSIEADQAAANTAEQVNGQGPSQSGAYAYGPAVDNSQSTQPPRDNQGQNYYVPPYPNAPGGKYDPNTGWFYGPRPNSSGYQPYNYSQNQQQGPQYGNYNQPYANNPNQKQEYNWHFEDYEKADQKRVKKGRHNGVKVFAIIMACVLGFAVMVSASYGVYSWLQNDNILPFISSSSSDNSKERTLPELIINEKPADSSSSTVLSDGRLSSVDMAKVAKPSVVGVAVYDTVNSFSPSGEGSGIIMNSAGYIITNAHVVEGAIGIQVILYNSETYTAQLVGIDTRTDLAVIKIDAKNLVAAQFGNSDKLSDGEKVMAIGNPGGVQLAGSVTQGIVSAINRPVKSDGGYSARFIQTDAAINPGNSGGALINEYGQVVGINSSKIVATGYEGIGFAIPINDAKPIVDDLIQYGRVTGRAKIGISGQEINEVVASINNLPTGIYIRSIDQNSELAGKDVKIGDIVTKIDGKDVTSFDDVSEIISAKKPGDKVELTIFRQASKQGDAGRTFKVTITLLEDGAETTNSQSSKAPVT